MSSSSSSSSVLQQTDPYAGYLKAIAHPLDCEACARGEHFYGPFKEIRRSLDYSYHQNYPEERQRVQDQIVNRFLGQAAGKPPPDTPPRILFTAGAMGAGKGYSLRRLADQLQPPLQLDAMVLIDPDVIKAEIPEYHALIAVDPSSAGTRIHNESAFLQEILFSACLARRTSVIIDGSLRAVNWNAQLIRQLRTTAPHYRPIEIFYVSAPESLVLSRAAARGAITGRHVPTELLRAAVREVPRSVKVLSQLVDATYYVTNVDVPRLEKVVRPSPQQLSLALEAEEIVYDVVRQSATAIDGGGGGGNSSSFSVASSQPSGSGTTAAVRDSGSKKFSTAAAASATTASTTTTTTTTTMIRSYSTAVAAEIVKSGFPTVSALDSEDLRLLFHMCSPQGGVVVRNRRRRKQYFRRTFTGAELVAWMVGRQLRAEDAATHARRLLETGFIRRVYAQTDKDWPAGGPASSSRLTASSPALPPPPPPQSAPLSSSARDKIAPNLSASVIPSRSASSTTAAAFSETDQRLYRLAKDDPISLHVPVTDAAATLARNQPINISVVTFSRCQYGELATLCCTLLRMEMGTDVFRFASVSLGSRELFSSYLRRRRSRFPARDVLARLHASSPIIFLQADGDGSQSHFIGGLDRFLLFCSELPQLRRAATLKQFTLYK